MIDNHFQSISSSLLMCKDKAYSVDTDHLNKSDQTAEDPYV